MLYYYILKRYNKLFWACEKSQFLLALGVVIFLNLEQLGLGIAPVPASLKGHKSRTLKKNQQPRAALCHPRKLLLLLSPLPSHGCEIDNISLAKAEFSCSLASVLAH